MESVLIISGWAHGIDAIQPMGDALANRFEVELRTGAQVLREQTIPEVDYIVTGSMGGLLALELLPESCKKLVLISSTARFCSDGDYPHGTPERVLQRMILQLQRNPEVVLDEFFRNVHYPHRESRQAKVLRKNAPMDIAGLGEGLEYLLESDIRSKVPTIRIPVLLLHGAEDQIIPPGASEWLHDHLPVSRLYTMANAGHALPAHHYSTIMKWIQMFLSPTP